MEENNIALLLGEIYEKYYKKIFRYFRRDFSFDDAEDLTQQTFLQLWGWLPRTDSVRSGRALIYSIARNVRADRYRNTAFMLETAAIYDFVEVPDSSSRIDEVETRLALDVLSVKERELLLMKTRGYTSEEIGKEFGISASAARTRLQKIRKKLAAKLVTD